MCIIFWILQLSRRPRDTTPTDYRVCWHKSQKENIFPHFPLLRCSPTTPCQYTESERHVLYVEIRAPRFTFEKLYCNISFYKQLPSSSEYYFDLAVSFHWKLFSTNERELLGLLCSCWIQYAGVWKTIICKRNEIFWYWLATSCKMLNWYDECHS